MKKILIVASVGSFVNSFLKEHVRLLQEFKYEVHFAANMKYEREGLYDELGLIVHHVEIQRGPFSSRNIIAYKQLKEIILREGFSIVHCHTPIGGVLGRIAAYKTNVKKVIYLAHGFHFYKGCPLQNRLIYENIEKLMARYTDVLITINQEDFKAASKFKLKERGKVFYIPGVGLDINKIQSVKIDIKKKKDELNIKPDQVVVLSVGELNENKNHSVILNALSQVHNIDFVYLICGTGPFLSKLINLSKKLKITHKVKFLGYRKDVYEIYKIADVFCFPSKREGLGMAALEAMACGVPIISSNVQGICDYSINGVTGFQYSPKDVAGFANGIQEIIENKSLRNRMKKMY